MVVSRRGGYKGEREIRNPSPSCRRFAYFAAAGKVGRRPQAAKYPQAAKGRPYGDTTGTYGRMISAPTKKAALRPPCNISLNNMKKLFFFFLQIFQRNPDRFYHKRGKSTIFPLYFFFHRLNDIIGKAYALCRCRRYTWQPEFSHIPSHN